MAKGKNLKRKPTPSVKDKKQEAAPVADTDSEPEEEVSDWIKQICGILSKKMFVNDGPSNISMYFCANSKGIDFERRE